MDVDAFVLAHRPTWDRLEQLVKRRRRLTGAEVDELVDLYQRVSTHLSMVRTASSDSVLVGRLSGLVARARSAVTGAHAPLWSEFTRFWTVSFPVVAYRSWRWWLGTAVAFFVVTAVIALWVSGNPEVQAAIGTPSEIDELVNHDFADYYSENSGRIVRAAGLGEQLVGGRPVHRVRGPARAADPVCALFQNAANLGVIGGPDVRRRQGRRLPGSAHPARPARADRGVPGRARRACGWAGRWCRPAIGRAGRCSPSRAGRWSRSPSGWSACCWSRG